MRASDPIFEIGQTTGGHKQEDRFWDHTLASVANQLRQARREGRQ